VNSLIESNKQTNDGG
jgi:hypothetical protein